MYKKLIVGATITAIAFSAMACKRHTSHTPNTAADLAAHVVDAAAEALVRDGSGSKWDELDRRLGALFANQTKEGDEAIVILMSFYLGEHEGEEVEENLLSRGPRMIPLVELYRAEEPSSLLTKYPKRVKLERTATLGFLTKDLELLDLSRRADAIDNLLRSGKFQEAEPLVRECLLQSPHEIHFLGQLEMSLNGQGKYAEDDQVAANVRQIWASEYTEEWLAKGSPVAQSSWARIMISTRDYYAIGVEYFLPHLVEGDPAAKDKKSNLMADYKVIALPKRKDTGSRIFQLNKTAWEKQYWLEEYSSESITTVHVYAVKPDIRAVTKAVADYLDQKDPNAGPSIFFRGGPSTSVRRIP